MGFEVASLKPEYVGDQWVDHNQILSEASFEWSGGTAAIGFGPYRNLVFMATDSSHRVIMGKMWPLQHLHF